MKNKLNRQDRYFFLALIVLISLLIGYLIYSIDELQDQIYERDVIIAEMNSRDQLSKNEYNALISSLNRLLGDAEIDEDGTFDVYKFIKKHNSLKDTISDLRSQLDLIKSYYGISAKTRKRYTDDNKVVINTSINRSERVDSALILLPYFRDRLILNEDGDTWKIKLTSEEFKNVKKQYEDKIFEYNELVNRFNQLLDKYNDLVDNGNERVKFFENLLNEMSEEGVIKIDTIGDQVHYGYYKIK